MVKISVAIATFNEEGNLPECLESVQSLADEVVIVDGSSSDKTVEIAKKYGARVLVRDNPPIFHINKQIALEECKYEWILQLDADERVSEQLAIEIRKIISLNQEELEFYQNNLDSRELFQRHQRLIEKRDGEIGTVGEFSAFFIPRLNYFLGKYLKYGGVYPDGVIRLVKKGKAYFPCASVHEQIKVNGRAGWLENPLYHKDSPTFARYLARNSRYIDLISRELAENKTKKSPFNGLKYLFFLPAWWFFLTYIRHKGILDSWQGFVFSLFSALRYPRAYLRYLKNE